MEGGGACYWCSVAREETSFATVRIKQRSYLARRRSSSGRSPAMDFRPGASRTSPDDERPPERLFEPVLILGKVSGKRPLFGPRFDSSCGPDGKRMLAIVPNPVLQIEIRDYNVTAFHKRKPRGLVSNAAQLFSRNGFQRNPTAGSSSHRSTSGQISSRFRFFAFTHRHIGISTSKEFTPTTPDTSSVHHFGGR